MSTDEIYKSLTEIANTYGIFQCQACANEMQQWLVNHNINGVYIRISTHASNFIVSERVGGYTTITENGIHYGIEVYGQVFDNLPNTGISRQAWLNDFECIGDFEVVETPF
ncbi:MAG: hypothetical protein NT075_06655 [Chloroflexi bacterium]|nr:hypothetical protein [Chloroflexota bacterium]